MSHERISRIETRLGAVAPGPWRMVNLPDGAPVLRVFSADRPPVILRITRGSAPARVEDVLFIAHAPSDLRRLLDHVRGERRCLPRELDAVRSRVHKSSPAPWKPFLKGKGGIGGDSVIWVSDRDDEPDLYLWIDSHPAPDAYFEFVAAARQDLPDLLEEAQQ